MSVIEGIGDEVLYLFLLVVIILALYISWLSTSVSPSSFTYVVAIDNALFSNIFGRFINNPMESSNNDSGQQPVIENGNYPTEAIANQSDDLLQTSTSSGMRELVEHTTEESLAALEVQNNSNEMENIVSDTVDQSCPSVVLGSDHSCNTDANSNEAPDQIRIRLQYIDGKKRTVYARPEETIGEFKRRNFSNEIGSHSVVRFIMGGRELKNDNLTLQFYNVKHDDVIHCLVSNAQPTERSSNQSSPSNSTRHRTTRDIGFFVFPMFGLALALTWYARIFYRGYFNGTSTFSLVAISFLYIMSLLASYRGGSQNDVVGHLHQD